MYLRVFLRLMKENLFLSFKMLVLMYMMVNFFVLLVPQVAVKQQS